MTIKLEAGKRYKTTGGRIAYIGYIRGEWAIGHFEDDDAEACKSWMTEGGRYSYHPDIGYNIIAEHTLPKIINLEGWANVYDGGWNYNVYPSKENADRYASKGRIACKHLQFEIVEGVFEE